MARGKVITVGTELDPAKRLRLAWGETLRELRKLKGWTLEQAAAELDGIVTPAAIGMWERGETAPRWHHQAAIARVYGVPRHVIFSDEAA